MEAEAVEDADGTVVVTVILREGAITSNTYVDLDSADELVATAEDGGERMLDRLQAGVYETIFSGDTDTDTLGIELVRATHDDATNTVGIMPDPFEITTEFGDTALSRAMQKIEVTWSPSGTDDEMLIEAKHVGCFFLERSQVEGDPGEFVIYPGELTSTDPGANDKCDASLSIWRSRAGRVDEVLVQGSQFYLRQIRTAKFISVP